MRYRLTCLTPVLVGDGQQLSPIDYMVWKDQVNVLDQRRIFRLLAKGPRLDSYLSQLKKADKLDFASWGGFAQNFADRRVPFEHASLTAHWEKARGESLFIPTFASSPAGPYLPATSIKGALRTGMLAARFSPGLLNDVAGRLQSDRAPRRPAEAPEDQLLGSPGVNRMKVVRAGDSLPIPVSSLRVYLTRAATLQSRGGNDFSLGWKVSPRGTVEGGRPADSTPVFAEMAAPGTVFEGAWSESAFFSQPEVLQALRWKEPPSRQQIFAAANEHSAELLDQHRKYADLAGLGVLRGNLDALAGSLDRARAEGSSCVIPIGWGGGLLSKSVWLDTDAEPYRQVMRQVSLYAKAVQTGFPFPKTRRIVFTADQPALLPGWVSLEIQE